jgi:hypothetical protein
MADERPRPVTPRKDDWRHKSAGGSTGRAGTSARGKKVFAMLAVILALGGVLVGLMYFLRMFRPPVLLSLSITEYSDRRYPPNPFAEQDSQVLLSEVHGAGSEVAINSQQKDLLREKLKDLSNRDERSLVLHISSLALSHDKQVFLLPADANGDRPDTWLRLSEVLEAMQACPTKRKLLILDVMKSPADPRLGMICNDVAERVEQAVREMSGCSFWVLCACSPGQVSLVSDDLRQSVFGYYLGLGLRGKADNHGPNPKADGRVCVKELADFVAEKVDRWAFANRGTRQTPLLLGAGEDFELSLAENDPDKPLDDLQDDYPSLLQEGWKARDGWLADGGLHDSPRVVRTLESVLLWAEHRWSGGFAFERVRENPITSLRQYQDQMRQSRPTQPPRSRSLAIAVSAARQEPDEPVVDELKDLAREADQIGSDKEKAAALQAVAAKQDAWVKKLDGQPLKLAEATYRAALHDPRYAKLHFLGELLNKVQPQPEFAETLIVQRLAAVDAKRWPTSLGSVRKLLRVARERERVIGADASLAAWIASPLEATASRQHEGEELLFSGEAEKMDRAGALLEDVERGYASCGRTVEVLQDATQLMDDAFHFLPGFVTYLTARPTPSATDEQSWTEAAHACRRIHELLANPPQPTSTASAQAKDDGESMLAIRQEMTTLRDRLEIMRKPFQSKNLEQLLVQCARTDAAPATVVEIQAMLATPLVRGEMRVALWKANLALSRRLHERMVAADADKTRPSPPLRPYGDSQRNRFESQERERAAGRALLSIGLLRLGGMEGIEPLEEERKKMLADSTTADWNSLGEKMRIAWSQAVPARMNEIHDLAKADCLSRIIPPLDPAVPSSTRLTAATKDFHRVQFESGCAILGRFYRMEAKRFPDGSMAAVFFRKAGDEFLESVP